MTAALPIPAARSGHLTTPDQLTTELSSELAAALDMLVSLATDARTSRLPTGAAQISASSAFQSTTS